MARPSVNFEPIASDPVIIDSPKTQETVESPDTPTEETTEQIQETDTEKEDLEESVLYIDNERSRFNHRNRVIEHVRTYSPPPRPLGFQSQVHRIPILIDTRSLNEFVKLDDVCFDTASNQMVFLANHPFHAADLDKISWIFRIGSQDTWVPKPIIVATSKGYQFDFVKRNNSRRGRYDSYDNQYDRYDDGYDRRNTAIVRLGNALRVFKTDEKKYETEKVKFVMAVQGKNNAGWFKLVVSHSRQAALVAIFHEIINGHSVQFFGAVLQDIVVPMEAPHKKIKFQRVGTLKEAQEVGSGVIGVIC